MQKNEIIIIIPIHKEKLSESESASLNQCIKILGAYPICFIGPNTLDIANYKNIVQNAAFEFVTFDDKHFKSVESYSKLMLTPDFYDKFIEYKYMLIHQLDAWVFKDELEYWIKQGYDYVGAPWFEGFSQSNEHSQLMKIAGNGGFSLRNISKIKQLLTIDYDKMKIKNEPTTTSKALLLINKLLHKFFGKSLWLSKKTFEDKLIVSYGPKLMENFCVAPPKIALKFAFETNPRKLFELNNKTLPFACHAFQKYDFDFWQQFIKF